MFEETARLKRDKGPDAIREQLRELSQTTTLAFEMLRQRQERLRPLGMTLPTGTLDTLRQMLQQLDRMTSAVKGVHTELSQLRGLAETSALITSALSLSDVLNEVMDKVVELTDAERGYIMLKDEQTGALEFRAARGIDREELSGDEFIISRTVVERVASTGESVLTHNAQDDPRYQGEASIIGFMLRSILAVPLTIQNGEVIGVVYCDNRVREGLFNEHERDLLQAFANQAAVAIQNARLFTAVRAQLAEISELRDLFDNIFTSIASGLITLNRNDIITAYNAAAERIIGVATLDALGTPLEQVLPPIADDFDEHVSSARNLPPQQQIELDLSFEDQLIHYWRVKLTALRDGTGKTEGVAMVLDDLTDTREREARLREAERYLPAPLVSRIRTLDLTRVGGEERVITALFADVRGFTSFSEKLDPETLMQVINEYLSRASDSIELFEGVVDKYMGDAVTGLFNTQLNPQTDHALRAVRSAVSMLYDVAALHETLPPDQRLFYGIGIHTGNSVLGSIGSPERREFSAIGEALDISKLLQENALGGEIIVSGETYALVSDYFEFEAISPRKVKAETQLQIIYRLIGVKKRSGEVSRVSG
jgi:PAS domain S-box-containing protein